MIKFKNMKIAITDKAHLKAVCDVLESIGYEIHQDYIDGNKFFALTISSGKYYFFDYPPMIDFFEVYTLDDLLRMRDEMVKNEH